MHSLLILLLGAYVFGVLFVAVVTHYNLRNTAELDGVPNWIQNVGSIVAGALWPLVLLVSVLASKYGKAKS